MEDLPAWVKLISAVIIAAATGFGAGTAAPPPEEATNEARVFAQGNCEAINEVKALARELIALSPVDPDISAEARARFTQKVAALTRPRDCEAFVQ